MTIVFQGHVKSVSTEAPIGKAAVTLQTPMSEAGGKEWTVFVPASDAAHWSPGLAVSFTIYTLPAATTEPKQ